MLMVSKITGTTLAVGRGSYKEMGGFSFQFSKSVLHGEPYHRTLKNHLAVFNEPSTCRLVLALSPESSTHGKSYSCFHIRNHTMRCHSTGGNNSETRLCSGSAEGSTNVSSCRAEDENDGECGSPFSEQAAGHSIPCFAEACRFVHNDAKFVNERARNDIILLARGLTSLNNRARQDVAVLGFEFLKLDARAREDTEKIDSHVKKKAACLHHIASILKDRAHSRLKNAADKHWSDGALEADLKRADIAARRRALEDAFMALKFVKNIHDLMANRIYQRQQKEKNSWNDMMGIVMLEKKGKTINLFGEKVSTDHISAIEDAYLSMASALTLADGIDYTDPEELELLVATLIDLDAMDSKSSVSLLAECSSSPDVETRKALANALATAPSMWTLGNAGMGALQRLAKDSNPAVAAAASKAINELKHQWEKQEEEEAEERSSLRFMMNQDSPEGNGDDRVSGEEQ
ncbi:hypothetical protein HPP92_027416 [Vanilla planifolia]|uniref:Uncharacterized protein n=1 Tax=Vanilla planifolia TaxID=51239 RepID=A0A835P997_VANPL|nr:hypothetical protein HPP92_027416 [Vanilla planifolia]